MADLERAIEAAVDALKRDGVKAACAPSYWAGVARVAVEAAAPYLGTKLAAEFAADAMDRAERAEAEVARLTDAVAGCDRMIEEWIDNYMDEKALADRLAEALKATQRLAPLNPRERAALAAYDAARSEA